MDMTSIETAPKYRKATLKYFNVIFDVLIAAKDSGQFGYAVNDI